MRVRMKLQTRWNGIVRKPGDTAEIDSNTALRWIKNGIAAPVESEKNETATAETTAVTEFDDLKYNELREIAKKRTITIPKGTKKPELIALLQESTEPPAEPTEKPAEEKKTD